LTAGNGTASATATSSGGNVYLVGGAKSPAGGVNGNVLLAITSTGVVMGNVGIGTSSPVANFDVSNASSTATTTISLGNSQSNKGTCLKLFRTDGTPIYASVAAGATTFTLSTTACASVTGF
jgi:hypothetical protein